jgi:hypothetical protein
MKNSWFEVKIILLPKWKDPDDIVKSGQDFNDFIKNALSPIWYYIKKSDFNTESIDEKKKLLKELLEITKSYSDNIEKDFYLKEISKLLDINQNIVYDSFNRIKFTTNTSKESNKEIEKLTSEEIAIWYCISNENNIDFFKKNILFKDWLSLDLKNILENWISYINTLELNKKEKLRGISLKIETENEYSNNEHSETELNKIVDWLNREIYKKLVNILKKEMNNWNAEAFLKYTHLISEAKKIWIK